MATEEAQTPDEREILRQIVEAQLDDITGGGDDQSGQALINLAGMIATLYKALIENELPTDVAVALTQTYVESVVGIMLNR